MSRSQHRLGEVSSEATASFAEAERLAAALSDGGQLVPKAIEGVPLAAGELAYGDLFPHGWRYFGLEAVAYERRTLLAGGPLLMAMTGVASAIGNRRRRQAAELMAAPQWRPLGLLRVVVTSERLLVWHENDWWSVWFANVTDVRPDAVNGVLELVFDSDPPYRLAGPGVASLGAVLACAMPTRIATA
ncbi:MAG: hypothetical protein WD830_11785 [Chloroflexota bacterium]